MFQNIFERLKTPIFISENKINHLVILKRIVLFALAAGISVLALPEAFFLIIARIDMWQELVYITKLDMLTGPVFSLVLFLLVHEYLPSTKIRRYAVAIYLLLALAVTAFFLYAHIGQVAYRSGISPFKVMGGLLGRDYK